MLMNVFCLLIMTIFSLISVAFLTLLERKMLGYIQFRKGPNKIGLMGLFQPFSDAIKLFTKEVFLPFNSNSIPYWLSPIFTLIVSVIVWVVFPYWSIILSWKFSFIFMFVVLSLNVYCIMISGWSSNSLYALLGCMRIVAQSISYEVSFFLLMFSMIYLTSSMSLADFNLYQLNVWFVLMMFPIFIMILVSFLAELNRTPFDFSEGESELVSGFNVEYGGMSFAFIFLGEYLSILFSSMVMSYLFLGSYSFNMMFYFKLMMLSLIIIIIRGTLPRYRYDKLMNLCWKIYLTCSLMFVIFYTSILYV